MGIKRGVSLYSYQQAQFFRQMDWKDMVREVRENLGTDGIEIIDQQIIRDYPFPSEEFIYDWNSYLARYDMKAVTVDVYMDVHQFRDHVMSHREVAERFKNDIRLAARMGFANIRPLSAVPCEVIEMALETAEKYNVRIGREIHAPIPIKPRGPIYGMGGWMSDERIRQVELMIDLAQRTGSKYVGLVPDMGIFQHSPSQVAIDYTRRQARTRTSLTSCWKTADSIPYRISARSSMKNSLTMDSKAIWSAVCVSMKWPPGRKISSISFLTSSAYTASSTT
jgi:hypothetical protein